jgi:ADP-ribosylglycohydrolase
MGTPDEPVGTSLGAHALTRSLPAGLASWWLSQPISFAREIAALTHAVPAADIACLGATLLAKLAQGHRLDEAVHLTQRDCAAHVESSATSIMETALTAAISRPRQQDALRQLASDRTASSALAGGVYIASCFPEPDQIRDAMLFAADHGPHVAATAGALLGAAAGVFALPVDLVSRLELAWVADALAHDLISEFVDSPSGSEHAPAADTNWWNRYPGW